MEFALYLLLAAAVYWPVYLASVVDSHCTCLSVEFASRLCP